MIINRISKATCLTATKMKAKSITLLILHLAVLVLSVLLIVLISIDTFKNVKFYEQPQFQHWQLWICIFFLAGIIIEFCISDKKWHFLLVNLPFLIVCIPFQFLIYYYDWNVSKEIEYIIRYMPLIRGGYAMAIVISWLTNNRATGLFISYLIILFSSVYFSSLTFYLFEVRINPAVINYSDALWWAAMDMTTVGSNIIAVTNMGRILSVLLAALGMMMFPIFTVYITNMITTARKNGKRQR